MLDAGSLVGREFELGDSSTTFWNGAGACLKGGA
jgi:hypothetical protein